MTWTEPIDPAPSEARELVAGSLPELELWAHCAACARWFPLQSDTIEAMAATHCPGCDATPDAFEERYGTVRFPVEMG